MALVVKNPLANARDQRYAGSILELGRSPAEGNGNPLQYSCLGNPMDRGGSWATIHRVVKSQTRLCTHTRPETEFEPSAVEVQNPNHWITREVPVSDNLGDPTLQIGREVDIGGKPISTRASPLVRGLMHIWGTK